MQTPILFLIALGLTVLAVAAIISMPQQPIPPEDAAFMAAVIEANTIGIRQERSAELQTAIYTYNAKRSTGDALIWTPPEF